MANTYTKSLSISLGIKEQELNNKILFHCTLIDKIKSLIIPSEGEFEVNSELTDCRWDSKLV